MTRRLRTMLAVRWRGLTGTAPAAAVWLGVLACLCTLLAVYGPRAAVQLRTAALRKFVATAPATDKAVVASIDDDALSTGQVGGLSAAQIQRVTRQLRRNLRGLSLAPPAADWSSLTTPLVQVTVPAHSPALQAVLPPKLELSYRDTLAANVHVVAGRLPAARSSAAAVLPIAVTVQTARRFGLAVGSRLALPGTGISLAVTAIVQPRAPASPFWTMDPVVAAPDLSYVGNYDLWIGGAFIAASGVGALQTRFDMTTTRATWMFPLDLGGLTAAQATGLRQRLAGALLTAGQLTSTTSTVTQRCSGAFHSGRTHPLPVKVHCTDAGKLAVAMSVSVTSGTVALIAGFDTQTASVGGVLDLLSVSLAVLAAAVVLLAAWLLAERRRQEFAMRRARGAARRQLAVAIFAASAATVLPGAAVGAAVGVALTPASSASLSWWLAGVVVLASLAGPVLVTVWIHGGYAPDRPDQPASRLASTRRLIVEAALLLVAAGGLIVLRDQGLGGGADLYPSAAPVLLAIGVAVIVLRVYPLVVRGLLRLTGRRAGPSAFLGLAGAARAPASATLPAFALVLTLGIVSFAGIVRGAVISGEQATSWQQAGADATVSTAGSVTAALQRSVAAVPGVRHVAAAGIAAGSIGPGPAQFRVLLVDPAQYAAILASGPLPKAPLAFTKPTAVRGRPPTRAAAPVLASPALAAELGTHPVSVLLNGQKLVTVRVVGQAPAMSAVSAVQSGYLVLNSSAAVGTVGGTGGVLLVAGPALSAFALRSAVAQHSPGATVVFRSRLLDGLAAAPLRHGAYLALLLGAFAAACCGLLVLLISLLLSAPSRRLVLVRLNTMGLSRAQGRLAVLVELLPQLLAVLAGGVACAVALGPALGPALNLTGFTGSAVGVPILLEPAWLAGTGLALLVLLLVVLTGQTSAARQPTARSLAKGEWGQP